MTPNDVLESLGLPAGYVGIGVAGAYVIKELANFKRMAVSTRDAAEKEFRETYLGRLKMAEDRLDAITTAHSDCEQRLTSLSLWALGVARELRNAGMDKFSPIPRDIAELAIRAGAAVESLRSGS